MQKSYDLIIIGSGVIGAFHAFHAAKKGLRVVLLERDQYPVGATVRNFGQCVPSGLSSEWFEYGRRSTEIYKEIQQEFDISARNNGSVYIASNDEEQKLIHELNEIMSARSYESSLLNTDQCLAQWPALRQNYCKEAIFFPQEVSVEPEKMIYRLLEYCKSRFSNLDLRSGTAVVSCETKNNSVLVRTADGAEFTAPKALVCTGHEFKLLFADLFRSSGIVVSKLQMLRTIPLPDLKLEGNILTGLTIRRYESFEECASFKSLKPLPGTEELKKWGIHILFKKAIDGSVIIGDSHEYAEVNTTDDLGFSVKSHVNELMLAEAEKIVDFDVRKIATSWAGFYSQHPEKNIVEYDIDDMIHIRTAIGGKGMSSSAGYAEASIAQIFNLN